MITNTASVILSLASSILFTSSIAYPAAINAMNIPMSPTSHMIESRLRSALWGMFSGDALAAPTHWYYGGFPQIQSDYGRGGITGYTRPVTQLSGSILNKSDPNGGGRLSYDSIGGKTITIIGDVINHGKLEYWNPKKSFHYHATLQVGENTLEMQLARVLMKSIVANNGMFDEDHFRKAYVKFMTTKGSHNDTYASTCHRMFFANMIFHKKDPIDCPDNDGHNVDAIDGLVLPSITALAETARQLSRIDNDNSLQLSEECRRSIQEASARTASVTRSSKLLERISGIWADLISAALILPTDKGRGDNDMEQPLNEVARQLGIRNPVPNSKDQMRYVTICARVHIMHISGSHTKKQEPHGTYFTYSHSACYLSQSLPPTLDMIRKYTRASYLNSETEGIWKALLANANIGGENVHRGAVLGAILGARVGDKNLPEQLKSGLYDRQSLEEEINSFVDAVMQKQSSTASSKVGEAGWNEL